MGKEDPVAIRVHMFNWIVSILCLSSMALVACQAGWVDPTPLPNAPLPTWHGITIGSTTSTELHTLLDDEVLVDFSTSKFPENYGVEKYVVGKDIVKVWLKWDAAAQRDTVAFIEIDVAYKSNLDMLNFVRPYGKPEAVRYAALGSRSYIYARSGIVVDSYGARVGRIEYFVPTSLDGYLASWGKIYPRTRVRDDLGELDPFHLMEP